MALLNRDKRREASERGAWVEFVEIATDPAFEKEFMAGHAHPAHEGQVPESEGAPREEGEHCGDQRIGLECGV